jgi:hypothetical protein
MKAAFGCQLAQQLHQTLGMEASASEDWVDVLTDGFAFRLLLATERDAAMQQKAMQISECTASMRLTSWLATRSCVRYAPWPLARGSCILAPCLTLPLADSLRSVCLPWLVCCCRWGGAGGS